MLTQCLLGVTAEDMKNELFYARVLAFSERGAKLLKKCRKCENRTIPILTNVNKEAHLYPELARSLAVDAYAADLYNLIAGNDLYENADCVRHPRLIKINE